MKKEAEKLIKEPMNDDRAATSFLTVRLVEEENRGGGPNGHFEVEILGDRFSTGAWALIAGGATAQEIMRGKAEAVMGGFESALLDIAERALRKRRQMKWKRLGLIEPNAADDQVSDKANPVNPVVDERDGREGGGE